MAEYGSLPFSEQIDFFLKKINLPSATWNDIQRSAHDRAFIVAGAMQADLVNDLRLAVDKVIKEGMTLEKFRQDFDSIVKAHGWTGWTGEESEALRAWRTKVIYETNLFTSYSAGRYHQLKAMARTRPYWRYRHAHHVRYPRQTHLEWDGIILRHDDPWWNTHFPPKGFGCQCYVESLAARDLKKMGMAEPLEVPKIYQNDEGIDQGWDYAPGANSDTQLIKFVEQKLFNLEAPIGAQMGEILRPIILEEQQKQFADFVDRTIAAKRTSNISMVIGSLNPEWVEQAEKRDVIPVAADITVRDVDIWNTFLDSKADQLDLDWYKQLPLLINNPTCVILDTSHGDPAFLLIFTDGNTGNKVVLRINYQIKKGGTGNVLTTGKQISVDDLSAQLGHGYEIIAGSL